ncbi:hypothetical protein, partial [Lysinibacillus xylanilyticus]|uniref:hypothetical protein n=1 Tax=Lysinibacillus xylanilyticus TaxID=582475 RepID=UPI0036DF8069
MTGTLVSLANLNVINLLLDGSDYGSGTSEAFNHKPEEGDKPIYLQDGNISGESLESLQSGLLGNGGGGKLNLLWLLQNAKDANKDSYAYQLLDVYSKLENGEYNNLPYHVSPDAIAGSHKNETNLASFAVPKTSGYGKALSSILGKNINGKKITLENAMKADIMGHAERTGSVWVDKDSGGGDGYPDGPFQIIQGKQDDSNANKNRSDHKYDLYNFVDAANVVDSKYNIVAKKFAESGSTPDARALSMLLALEHNRGGAGVGQNLFGFPYNPSKKSGNYIKHSTISSMTARELEIAAMFPKDLLKWLDASNVPLESLDGGNERGQGVATLLTLANGGFIDIPLQKTSISNIQSLGDGVIGKIFPGQTSKSIVNHINSKYVKQPWDVLGIPKSKYDSTYGSVGISNYEQEYSTRYGYYRNTVFYIDPKITSTNYTAGENTVVVRAIEGIALGYMVDVGFKGTYTVLSIALEAGIKSLTNGGIIDPSNPANTYKSNESKENDTYNPAGAATGNFGKFLDALGLAGKLSVTQQAQIEAMYQYSGGPYSQPRRGSAYKDGLLYLDCSSFASIGLYMGLGSNKQFTTTATVDGGAWLKSTAKTNAVNGKTYTAKVVQLDKNGNPMKESTSVNRSQMRTDTSWLGYLQAGDMVNGRGSNGGHIWTYLGKN